MPDSYILRWIKEKKLLPDMIEVRNNDAGIRTRRLTKIPELDVCRKAFSNYLKQPIVWEEDESADKTDRL